MKIGVLGTGLVGSTLASKLVGNRHEVMMGSRAAGNEKSVAWARSAGMGASQGSFADAAAFGELVFNCTPGMVSLDALNQAGAGHLEGKILVDVANPLDFSKGMPPRLSVSNDDSLAEQIQRAFPKTRVVKALNTVNASIMVDPARVKSEHDLLICGNDAEAKAKVVNLLQHDFGWRSVIDLGDITAARGMEAYLLLWLRLWGALQTTEFNLKLAR